jgi:polysaccharide export outer membrane protein
MEIRSKAGIAWGALCALLMVLAGCASHPAATGIPREVAPSGHGTALPPPDSTGPGGAYEAVSEYRIGPHDLLQITVFQVDELSRQVRVNSRGMVSLPLIGAIQAGGRTISELESAIAEKLATDLVQDPQVTVFVQEFTSQRVTVEGAVKKPGIFPLTGKTTLLQTIALSEGLDPLADPESVVIFRMVQGKKTAALFDIRRIRSGDMDDPLIYGDDIVVVDRSGSRAFIKNVTDTLRGFVGFRPVY